MGSERSVEVFVKYLLLLLSIGRWPVTATIPNGTITECSTSRVSFEYLQRRTSDLQFVAACLTDNRTCVHGVFDTLQIIPEVGDQITVTLSSCDENRQLVPANPGLCTLQIASTNFFDWSISTSVHVCTLPTVQSTANSSSAPTVPMLNSTGTASNQLDTTLSIAVPLSLLILFLIIVFAVAIASLILWTKHAQIKARRTLRIEEVVINVSPSYFFGTGDDYIPGDNLTLYEDFDEVGDDEGANKSDLPLPALKNGFSANDDTLSVTDHDIMKNTLQNSPPSSSLNYHYVVIRTGENRESPYP